MENKVISKVYICMEFLQQTIDSNDNTAEQYYSYRVYKDGKEAFEFIKGRFIETLDSLPCTTSASVVSSTVEDFLNDGRAVFSIHVDIDDGDVYAFTVAESDIL